MIKKEEDKQYKEIVTNKKAKFDFKKGFIFRSFIFQCLMFKNRFC